MWRVIAVSLALVAAVLFLLRNDGDIADPMTPSPPPVSKSVVADASAPAEAREEETSEAEPVEQDATPRFDIAGIEGPQQILDHFGVDGNYRLWMEARGFSQDSAVNSAYLTFDEQELRDFSAQGDRQATMMLANRLLSKGSIETLDMTRQAVAQGSIASIWELSSGHRVFARFGADPSAGNGTAGPDASRQEPGTEMLTDAVAWALLGESYTGLPRGSITASLADELYDDQGPMVDMGQACQRAADITADLEYEWGQAGFTKPAIEPRPFYPGRSEAVDWVTEACPPSILPTPDFSDCLDVELIDQDGDPEDAFLCPTGSAG